MHMFKIIVGPMRSEFAVIGVANIATRSAKFQGTLNGIPFTESADYEKVRARVMKAVELNNVSQNKELS